MNNALRTGLTFVAAGFLTASGFGQVLITTSNTPVTITFDTTLDGVASGSFSAAGFSSSPGSGQLDSHAWAVTGWSDGALDFGGTATTGDYARGNATAAVSIGGMYSYSAGTDHFLMIQPGGSDWAPGTLTLKVTNGMGKAASAFNISYDLLVRNDQGRANSFDFSYSLDGGTTFVVTDLSSAFSYTSIDTAVAGAPFSLVSSPSSGSITMSSNLAANDSIFLRWSGADVSGSGSRDEFGLDNISVGMVAIPEPSTYAAIMGALTLGFALWRRRAKKV